MTWTAPTENLKALEQELALRAKVLPVQDKIYTTNATVTTLHTATIPVNTSVLVDGFVVARRTGGSAGAANDGAGYTVQFVAKNTTGTAALIGSGTVTALGESVAGWDLTLAASAGTILVQATGAADTNVSWVGSFTSLSVKA